MVFQLKNVSRRDALRRLGGLGLVTTAAIGGGLWRRGQPRRGGGETGILPDFSVARSSSYAELAVARGGTAAGNTRAAIEALGGMGTFIDPGDRVMLKPNVAWKRIPKQAATTNPEVVATLARLCFEAGAKAVVVFDSPCDAGAATFLSSGMIAHNQALGVRLAWPGKADYVKADFGGALIGRWPVWQELPSFDKLINVPIVKHHVQSRATCGMKNWYGVLGGDRGLLHQDINGSIVDLADAIRPTLTVLDAQRLLLRNGPTGGSLGDVKENRAVAAGVDPVALDAWGVIELGQHPSDIPFLAMAEARKIGVIDFRERRLKEVSGV